MKRLGIALMLALIALGGLSAVAQADRGEPGTVQAP
jgi:hypothetical protein